MHPHGGIAALHRSQNMPIVRPEHQLASPLSMLKVLVLYCWRQLQIGSTILRKTYGGIWTKTLIQGGDPGGTLGIDGLEILRDMIEGNGFDGLAIKAREAHLLDMAGVRVVRTH